MFDIITETAIGMRRNHADVKQKIRSTRESIVQRLQLPQHLTTDKSLKRYQNKEHEERDMNHTKN